MRRPSRHMIIILLKRYQKPLEKQLSKGNCSNLASSELEWTETTRRINTLKLTINPWVCMNTFWLGLDRIPTQAYFGSCVTIYYSFHFIVCRTTFRLLCTFHIRHRSREYELNVFLSVPTLHVRSERTAYLTTSLLTLFMELKFWIQLSWACREPSWFMKLKGQLGNHSLRSVSVLSTSKSFKIEIYWENLT